MLDEARLRRIGGRPAAALSPFQASEAALALGGLARWWLRPEVLRLAAEAPGLVVGVDRASWAEPLRLAPSAGACWVVVALDQPGAWPALRPAALLPLRWERDRPHSQRLPAVVTQEADAVVKLLMAEPGIGGVRWGLQPGWDDAESGPDLSSLTGPVLGCRSGWAALAGGLLVAAAGGRPDARVWATGRWEAGRGIAEVAPLQAKLCLAAELGAAWFFVPEPQSEEASRLITDLGPNAPRIGTFAGDQSDPMKALQKYRLLLDAPPDLGDPFAVRARYYLRSPLDRRDYYRGHLLPEIIERCREIIQRGAPGWTATHLATIVSGSPDLVLLTTRVLDVGHCLLLHDKGHEPDMSRLREILEGEGVECTLALFRVGDELGEQFQQAVTAWVAQSPGRSRLVLDLTPGTKEMSLMLVKIAPRGSRLFYLRHEFDKNLRVAVPGSESPELWPVGEPSEDD